MNVPLTTTHYQPETGKFFKYFRLDWFEWDAELFGWKTLESKPDGLIDVMEVKHVN